MRKHVEKNNKIRLILFSSLAVLLVLIAIFGEHLCPYDPYLQDLRNAKAAPSLAHIFGTDRYGRDMLSRLIVGAKASILSTLLLVSVITIIGTIVGIICGWSGNRLDTLLMRITDIFLAFPGLASVGPNMQESQEGRPCLRRTPYIWMRPESQAALHLH